MARTLQGVVVSDKADKTIVVRVDRRTQHPIYKKSFLTSKRYHVHDEKNAAHIDDKVTIIESKPISKTKRWTLGEILKESAV